MNEGVPVVPIILRDRQGNFRVTYAKKTLQFRGTLLRTAGAPQTWLPANPGVTSQPWSLVRQEVDLKKLMGGAFVYWVATPTLNIHDPTQFPGGTGPTVSLGAPSQAYYEMMYMNVVPKLDAFGNPDPMYLADTSKYTYNVLMRGCHNTALGNFDPLQSWGGAMYLANFTQYFGMNRGSADVYMVTMGSNTNEIASNATDARDTKVPGFDLPNQGDESIRSPKPIRRAIANRVRCTARLRRKTPSSTNPACTFPTVANMNRRRCSRSSCLCSCQTARCRAAERAMTWAAWVLRALTFSGIVDWDHPPR